MERRDWIGLAVVAACLVVALVIWALTDGQG